MNANGVVVGSWFSPNGIAGFIDQGGAFSQINVPGSIYTYTTGINDSGEITGWYLDPSDQMHSYVATPIPEPASFISLALGCAVLSAAGFAVRGTRSSSGPYHP